ncbi:MAG: DUF2793 domain-containing protein [Rhodobacteraceae bacterium]|nr:DUF2793 domain-containing protein [Paracoccaceae bacterium]
MSDTSANLALPYMQSNQSQKHVTHNEALRRLDILVQLVVEEFDATTPPGLPTDGAIWALGSGATGDWAGEDGMLAAWVDGAWVFVTPLDGWRAYGHGDGLLRTHSAGAWSLPTVDTQNLDGVGIGTTSDNINRLAVSSEATLLSHEGNGHQLKLNKAASADTGSLLFQTNWSGRAEMGLAGEDEFSIKVSADGSTWQTPLRLNSGGLAELTEVEVSGGIKLGGVADENRLSHYETGSYTPSLIDMSGNSVSLSPKSVTYVRIGCQVTVMFNFLNNLSTSGLVATDDIALTLPFTNGSHSFCAVELQGPVGKSGPYFWHALNGQAYAKIRALSANDVLSVSDFTSGSTDIIGGTLTLCIDS